MAVQDPWQYNKEGGGMPTAAHGPLNFIACYNAPETHLIPIPYLFAHRYPLNASPYEGVEFVWNHQNFWVCMQVCVCVA